MRKGRTFLAVDLGAATLKLAEFERDRAGIPRLIRYGLAPLDAQDSPAPPPSADALAASLRALRSELGCQARQASLCAPGSLVFSKFIKLPVVARTKIAQVIQYEARQIIPFPLAEVVWDHQILQTTAAGELEALLLAIKSDVVGTMCASAEAAGLKVQRVEGSLAALANAFRFNYGELTGCSLLLDLGARSSTVLLLDGDHVFGRVLNLGAHAITQEFARECRLDPEEAERIKRTEGFVALGETQEEPSAERTAVLSRAARHVLTRLHAHLAQTIQFYRSQHSGAAPERLFLAGGGASLAFVAQFLGEKLHLPVEYFNPLRQVPLDPSLDLEELARVAHTMGEVVGLALREVVHCPLELSLTPPGVVRKQRAQRRRPWLLAGAAACILSLLGIGHFLAQVAQARSTTAAGLETKVALMKRTRVEMDSRAARLKAARPALDELDAWWEGRSRWSRLLSELGQEMRATEAETRPADGSRARLWLHKLEPVNAKPASANYLPRATRTTNLVEVTVGARDLTESGGPDANSRLIFALLQRLQTNPFFAPEIIPAGEITASNRTFYLRLRLSPAPPERSPP